MSSPTRGNILIANDLLEGDVLFMGETGWVSTIALARIGYSPEEHAARS